MARINIEDTLFIKNAWLDLLIAVGDKEKALGALNWAWIVAQRFYVPERKPIPRESWLSERLNDALIKCGFAEETEDGLYMKGSEEQFAWLFQRYEAGAKRGRAKKSEPIEAIDHEETDRLATDNRKEATDNRVEPSYSSSISYSLEEDSSSSPLEPPATQPKKSKSDSNEFWEPRSPQEVYEGMSQEKRDQWALLYPDKEFMKREFIKAFGYYCHDNPKRKPRTRKSWSRTMSSWLERGWRDQVRAIPAQKPSSRTQYVPTPQIQQPPDPDIERTIDRICTVIAKHGRHGQQAGLNELGPELSDVVQTAGGWGNLDAYSDSDRRKELRVAFIQVRKRVGNQTSAAGDREKAAQAQALTSGLAGILSMPQMRRGNA